MTYKKGNAVYNGTDITVGEVRIVNPTTEQLLQAGYTAVEDEPTTPDLAAVARAELAEGDYRIIKCAEAFLTGEPLPYDIAALHAERQRLRQLADNG